MSWAPRSGASGHTRPRRRAQSQTGWQPRSIRWRSRESGRFINPRPPINADGHTGSGSSGRNAKIAFMFKGLEHTAIASPNPQKLAQWYVDHLDFVINYTYDGNYFVKAKNGSMKIGRAHV